MKIEMKTGAALALFVPLACGAVGGCERSQEVPNPMPECVGNRAEIGHQGTPRVWRKSPLGPVISIEAGPSAQSAGQTLQIGRTGTLHATVREGGQGVLSGTKTEGEEWRFEALTESAGGHSLAVDSGGGLHVAHGFNRRGPYPRLHYATNDGGAWTDERVHPDVDSGHHPEIALDSSGVAYIAHSVVRTLRVVRRPADVWTEVAGAQALPGRSSNRLAMAFDSDDILHLTYHDFDQALVYATNLDGQWTTEILATTAIEHTSFDFVSIAIDNSSRVHIIHFDSGSKSLLVLRKQCGSWTKETILSDAERGYWAAMVVEASGVMHVAYVRDDVLLYMSDRGGAWSTESVSLGVFSGSEAIAVSDTGQVHIIYSLQDGEMMYATSP